MWHDGCGLGYSLMGVALGIARGMLYEGVEPEVMGLEGVEPDKEFPRWKLHHLRLVVQGWEDPQNR